MQFICDGSAATAQCDSRWFVFCDVLKALVVLHKWIEKNKENATGNELERALKRVNREDIINQCMHNVEEVTDEEEKVQALAFLGGPTITTSG